MFQPICCLILTQLITCGEVISDSNLGGEIRHVEMNLQAFSKKVLVASHFSPNQLAQSSRTREIIMLNETSTALMADFEDPDLDSGLETRGGCYDAFFSTRKKPNPVQLSTPPPPQRQYSSALLSAPPSDVAPWRTQSWQEEIARAGPGVKKTRAPGGFLYEDDKAGLHFCCCCCLAHWCNKIPYHPKEKEPKKQSSYNNGFYSP